MQEAFLNPNAFQLQKAYFFIGPACVPRQASVAAEHAVAGYDDGYRIVPHGAAYRLCGHMRKSRFRGDLRGDRAVGRRFPVGDRKQNFPNLLTEGEPERERGGVKSGFFPEKYISSHASVHSNTDKNFSSCSFSSVRPKYFCPSNQSPVRFCPSLAVVIAPRGDEYLCVYCIFLLDFTVLRDDCDIPNRKRPARRSRS